MYVCVLIKRNIHKKAKTVKVRKYIKRFLLSHLHFMKDCPLYAWLIYCRCLGYPQ